MKTAGNRPEQKCRRHMWLQDDRCCGLCGTPRPEHVGLDHKGVWRACIQDVHFCWPVGRDDDGD